MFPYAILHIDGDAFFASCEQARNPKLQGLPVVTGQERGIASSLSYEAKRMGVKRGMSMFEIKRICPSVIILPSDYETYSLLSHRFYSIVRRFTSSVEEYGIDECFADLTGLEASWGKSYLAIAQEIQQVLYSELGFSFSIGLSVNKVLAKVGSKWNKPHGLTVIDLESRTRFLQNLPTEKIWGIGPATSLKLSRLGVSTALELAEKNHWWVKLHLAKPFWEIWCELRGEFVLPLQEPTHTTRMSIQKFKTFTPPSKNRNFVLAQVCKNVENACIKARGLNLRANGVLLVLRTQTFTHFCDEITLHEPTNLPSEIIQQITPTFTRLFTEQKEYRAVGVTLLGLKSGEGIQLDLFNQHTRLDKLQSVYKQLDLTRGKYGKHTVFLGSSFMAHQFSQHKGVRGSRPQRQQKLFLGETKRRRLHIPVFLGEVG